MEIRLIWTATILALAVGYLVGRVDLSKQLPQENQGWLDSSPTAVASVTERLEALEKSMGDYHPHSTGWGHGGPAERRPGGGRETTYLKLYLPRDGEVGWGASVRQNFERIDDGYARLDTRFTRLEALWQERYFSHSNPEIRLKQVEGGASSDGR
jgi:hypothetical protein